MESLVAFVLLVLFAAQCFRERIDLEFFAERYLYASFLLLGVLLSFSYFVQSLFISGYALRGTLLVALIILIFAYVWLEGSKKQ